MIDYAINQQVLPDGNFVFLDCETANSNQEICQIGALVVSKNKVIEKIDKYVKNIEKIIAFAEKMCYTI